MDVEDKDEEGLWVLLAQEGIVCLDQCLVHAR